MHPVQEYRNELAALTARFDRLEALITATANPNSGTVVQGAVIDPSRPMPPGFQADPNGGPPRHVKTGQVYRGADADTRPYLERRLEADAAHTKEGADYLADARAKAVAKGFPEGVHILEDGLPRNIRDGKLRPDLMTATYSPPPDIQPTMSMRAANLRRSHPEQRDGHAEMDDVVTDEDAEVLRLRRPDPVTSQAIVAQDVAPAPRSSAERPIAEHAPERPLSLAEQLAQLASSGED
jgi:hypothetical protein